MGHGSYSFAGRSMRAVASGYDHKSTQEIFKQRSVNNAMDPNGVTLRESRDSVDHPETFPIILALDETGSMGSIPHYLVKEGLPHMMEMIMANGIAHPQVLFLGIGDHECDRSPLQVGQFESSDPLLDKWLTDLYLEGGGGGNAGESYLLAWFFAQRYTVTDHLEKRGKKGLLITIGDEPVLKELSARVQKEIMGDGEYLDTTALEQLDKARERYDVFHLHMLQGSNGNRQDVKDGWKELMGDNCTFVQRREEVPTVIASIITGLPTGGKETVNEAPEPTEEILKPIEEML